MHAQFWRLINNRSIAWVIWPHARDLTLISSAHAVVKIKPTSLIWCFFCGPVCKALTPEPLRRVDDWNLSDLLPLNWAWIPHSFSHESSMDAKIITGNYIWAHLQVYHREQCGKLTREGIHKNSVILVSVIH